MGQYILPAVLAVAGAFAATYLSNALAGEAETIIHAVALGVGIVVGAVAGVYIQRRRRNQ